MSNTDSQESPSLPAPVLPEETQGTDFAHLSYLQGKVGDLEAQLAASRHEDEQAAHAQRTRIQRVGRRLGSLFGVQHRAASMSAESTALRDQLHAATHQYVSTALDTAGDQFHSDVMATPASPSDVDKNPEEELPFVVVPPHEPPERVENREPVASITPERVSAIAGEVFPFTHHYDRGDQEHGGDSLSLQARDPDSGKQFTVIYGGERNMFGRQSRGDKAVGSTMSLVQYHSNGDARAEYWTVKYSDVVPGTGGKNLSVSVSTSYDDGYVDANLSMSRVAGTWQYDGADYRGYPEGVLGPVEPQNVDYYVSRLERLLHAAREAEVSTHQLLLQPGN